MREERVREKITRRECERGEGRREERMVREERVGDDGREKVVREERRQMVRARV